MSAYKIIQIPNGDAGIKATLDYMADVINRDKIKQEVRESALAILQRVPAKNPAAEISAIGRWVQENIRYTWDVNGVETVQGAAATLRLKAGDCDDMAVLAGALLESVGHPVRLVALDFGGGFSHVVGQAQTPEGWMTFDCTESEPIGWTPTPAKRCLIKEV